MRLGNFLHKTEVLDSYLPNEELDIDIITNDSREIFKNSLYIAIPGNHWDGHIFLKEVLKKGAKAVIVERIDRTVPITQYKVPNSRLAWSNLSAGFFNDPSKEMFVYGITATNGKTTIAFMLDEILRTQGLNTGLIGTVKIRMGQEVNPASMTTPESFELQQYLDKMRKVGVDTVTMEISSVKKFVPRLKMMEMPIVNKIISAAETEGVAISKMTIIMMTATIKNCGSSLKAVLIILLP